MIMSRVAVAPSAPKTVYVGSSHGIFVSTDQGKTWAGLGADAGGTSQVSALTVSPAAATTAYAGTGSGALITVDGGATWSPMNSGLPLVDGIFKSVNGAATWTLSNNGVGSYPSNIVVDPANSTVYTSTYDAGVFQSNDFGNTWNPINRGLDVPSASLQWLALDPTSHRLFIATFMRGVASMVIDRSGD